MLSDHMLRQMVDAMPMPVFVKDGSDRYVYVNRAFETLFQVRSERIVGHGGSVSSAGTREVDLLRPARPMWSSRLTESATFVTATGEKLTMGVVHLGPEPANAADADDGGARRRETDPVTKCVSRRALQAHEDDAFSAAAGVIRISVDGYDRVAHRFGAAAADARLAEFSDIVRDDIRPGDVFARIGDNDFTVVLWGADREQTAQVARRISTRLGHDHPGQDQNAFGLSITVGTAFTDADHVQLSTVIAKAEEALLEARPRLADAVRA